MIWLALIIPVIGAIVMLIWFREKMTWWEVILPLFASFLFILIFKFTVEKVQVSDTEYWGSLGRRAEYYEPYTTWVSRTCSRQVPCGTDSKGNTKYCTEYYDCSYCDENGPSWVLTNDQGETFYISEKKFRELSKRWNSKPRFVELNRSINYHFGCGQDGDKYVIDWDGKPITSEPTSESHSYENRVQAAHTAFDFPDVSESDVKEYGLFEYSKVNGYYQNCILGMDQIQWIPGPEKDTLIKMMNYLNGEMGPRKQLRTWILFFEDKPELSAFMQEAYWKGGNKNEMVVCIGLSSHTRDLQWVKAFSWTPNRTLLVEIRENIMNTKKFSGKALYEVLRRDLEGFQRKQFKEFNYITVDPPSWSITATFLITIIITVSACYWTVVNDLEHDKDNPLKSVFSWENRRRRF